MLRRFESFSLHQVYRGVVQLVERRSPKPHVVGSNPAAPANSIWGYSSAGRAPALQAGGRRFESVYLHQMFLDSSAVEHPAVNRRVVGSNPTRGAIFMCCSHSSVG